MFVATSTQRLATCPNKSWRKTRSGALQNYSFGGYVYEVGVELHPRSDQVGQDGVGGSGAGRARTNP